MQHIVIKNLMADFLLVSSSESLSGMCQRRRQPLSSWSCDYRHTAVFICLRNHSSECFFLLWRWFVMWEKDPNTSASRESVDVTRLWPPYISRAKRARGSGSPEKKRRPASPLRARCAREKEKKKKTYYYITGGLGVTSTDFDLHSYWGPFPTLQITTPQQKKHSEWFRRQMKTAVIARSRAEVTAPLAFLKEIQKREVRMRLYYVLHLLNPHES